MPIKKHFPHKQRKQFAAIETLFSHIFLIDRFWEMVDTEGQTDFYANYDDIYSLNDVEVEEYFCVSTFIINKLYYRIINDPFSNSEEKKAITRLNNLFEELY